LLDKLAVDPRNQRKALPAIMVEENSRAFWANSEALKRAGINSKSESNPPGGVIVKNQFGEPCGILINYIGVYNLEKTYRKSVIRASYISFKNYFSIMRYVQYT